MKKRLKKVNKGFIKRITCVLNASVLLSAVLYSPELSAEFREWILTTQAAVPTILINKDINSLRELYEFSEEYASGENYDQCELRLANSLTGLTLESSKQFQRIDEEGNLLYYVNVDSEETTTTVTEYPAWETLHYTPIGTATKPFKGRVKVHADSGTVFPIYLDEPMFGTILDSVQIVRDDYSDTPISLNRSGALADGESEALFAQSVEHDTRTGASPATWSIDLNPSVDEHGTYHIYDYSGLIGTVGTSTGDQTVVNLQFANKAVLDGTYANIQSDSSVGMICGSINSGSTVNVSFKEDSASDSSYTYNVTSDNGSAGKLVGEMAPNSELNVTASSVAMIPSAGTVDAKEYAGALVGKNDCGTVSIKNSSNAVLSYTSTGTVTAETGAGGIFGYYKANGETDFSSDYIVTGCSVNANYAGGLVGVFESNGYDVTYTGTASSVLTNGNMVKAYGGLFGRYAATSLENTFTIDDASVTVAKDAVNAPTFDSTAYFAGVIGEIRSEDSDDAAYIYVTGNSAFTASSGYGNAKYFGGIVGNAGSKGSMIDIGDVTVSTGGAFTGGGLVGNLDAGVLRLSGTTDLSGAKASSGGQLVGAHGSALIYALGTGEDPNPAYGSSWRFVRSTDESATDDIANWGEVVRIPNIEGKAAEGENPAIAAIVTYDHSAHTATISAANPAITDERTFTQTALNMQMNDGADVGALCFADKSAASKRNDLLKSNLTISGTINLSGTGITGLMRDNNNDNKFFNGSITGSNNAAVKLAAGERYGVLKSTTTVEGQTQTVYTPVAANSGYHGVICTHTNNGLLARTGAGVTVDDTTTLPNINDVKIDGTINVTATGGDINIGGAVAYVRNGINLSGVDAIETINYSRTTGDNHYVGGLIGYVYSINTNNDKTNHMSNISITKSSAALSISPSIIVTGTLQNDSHAIGGVIGYINTDQYQEYDINISDVVLSANIDASDGGAPKNAATAGLIANISNIDTDKRDLNLTNINVKNTRVSNLGTTSSGGILGNYWNNTNVTLDNVQLNSLTVGETTSHNVLTTPAEHVGGLVYKATGHWTIGSEDLIVNSLNLVTTAAKLKSLGVLIHDGHNGSNGVFLELTAADSYQLADNNALTIPMPTQGNKVYDELVAYLATDQTELLKNGTSGVISVHTSGSYSMNESACNSYQNTYNTSAKNKFSRYYYNVDGINRTAPANGWKLLVWSLNRYAASNIKRCFNDPFDNNTDNKVVSGTFDLNGISYYPIDIGADVTLGDVTVKFYNSEIETTEALGAAGRLTRDGLSQHYTMHCGLFRNVTKTITANGDIHLQGNSGITTNNNAAFIGGSLTGTLTTSASKQIYLEGITISDSSKYLLINGIGSNATLNLYGLSAPMTGKEHYSTTEVTNGVASSLIGDVVGVNISLDFKNIKLDARKSTSADGNNYGTSKSIFTNATLLNRLDIDSTSKAKYNYSHNDDWGTGNHKVTYGKEIIDSQENSGQQKEYYEETGRRYFTRPDNDPVSNGTANSYNVEYTSFNSNSYLPYVKDYKDGTGYTYTTGGMHEIKVNVLIEGLTSGCGTYNDPYIINSLGQLEALDKFLRGDTTVNKLRLPVTKQTQAEFAQNHWCSGIGYDAEYTFTNNKFGAWTRAEAREYLAGAYYQINGNIDIPASSSFTGLGDTASGSEKYAFRGVIVGNGTVRITNHTAAPFIRISNGAVVRNVDFTVDIASGTNVVENGSNSTYFAYTLTNKNLYYGAVMGEIMGGDNIIDDVSVTYSRGLTVSGSNSYLYTVGGFVGVVVNGGLIFRNMPETNLTAYSVNTNYQDYELVTGSGENEVRTFNSQHLYINPYVGRVINGYAINEVNPTADEDAAYGDYTLENSTKNYRIPDLITGTHTVMESVPQLDENQEPVIDEETGEPVMIEQPKLVNGVEQKAENYNRLDVDLSTASDPKIKIPDGQSLFMLSLITQSGAGSAPSADGVYAHGIAYEGTTRYSTNAADSNPAAKNVATHLAQYNDVGSGASNAAGSDYAISQKDTVASTTGIPYIIYNYTKAYSGNYPARTVTGYATPFKMELTQNNGTYDLPDCFRGIGSICKFTGGSTGQVQKKGDTNYTWTLVDEDGKYDMKIYGFDGNQSTINIHLNYNAYCNDSDNYSKLIYTADNINLGFGLFNYVVQTPNATTTMYNALYGKGTRPETSTIPNYNLSKGYYIGNFTLSGIVKVSEYQSNGAIAPIAYSTGEYKSKVRRRFSVGGVIGALTVNNYVNLFKLNMSDMTVEGANDVGGYIGRNNVTERDVDTGLGMNYIYANACSTDGLTVTAHGGYCGGMVAGGMSGFLDLFVNTAPNTIAADAALKGNDGYYKSTMNLTVKNDTGIGERGTGGVLGSIRNGYMVNLWINNVTISGNEDDPVIENSNSSTTGTNGVGGLIGFVRKADTIILTNCTVNNINITGPSVGGLTGCISFDTGWEWYGLPPVMKVYNCIVSDNDTSTVYKMTGKVMAGGICGYFQSNQSYKTASNAKGYDYDSAKNNVYVYDIDGCEVSGYTIEVNGTNDADNGSGGIIGYAAQAERTIVNSSVNNCTVKINGSKTRYGMGGIIGFTNTSVSGYNISSYNNTFAYNGSGTSAVYGNFIGNANNKTIKIVGFSVKDNVLGSFGVSTEQGGTVNGSSYIVCADYLGASEKTNPNTALSGLTVLDTDINHVDDGAKDNYFPFVITNPKTSVGSSAFFTGDGAALYNRLTEKKENGATVYEPDGVTPQYESAVYPLAKALVDDIDDTSGAKVNNKSEYVGYTATSSVNDKTRVAAMFSNTDDLKLTTYGDEIGLPTTGYHGGNFPIIALDGSGSPSDYTNYITSYIRLLTNTTEAFTGDVSNKYKIKIYRCRINPSTGEYYMLDYDPDKNGLKLTSNKYSMDNKFADTYMPNNQISLIDVQFYDPTDATKIAYHLYVPVLTKRMVNFQFSSSVSQGSEYKTSQYSSFGNTNPGNFDNWVTAYVKYEYTISDLNTYLEGGKGLNWNVKKAVTFEYSGQRAVANSTQFVLLDNNNGLDREFYLTKSQDASMNSSVAGGSTTDTLRFEKFKTTRKDQEGVEQEVVFTPQVLNAFVGERLQYSTSDTIRPYVECGKNDPDMIAWAFGSGGKKWFKAGTTGTTYGLKISGTDPIIETYYISMYAYGANNKLSLNNNTNDAYNILISCPKTLSCDTATCKRSNGDATPTPNATLYLGNIFTQTLSISGLNSAHQIDSQNNKLTATLTSNVTFTPGDNAAFFQNGLSGQTLYQAFMLCLKQYDENGIPKNDHSIKGAPMYEYLVSTTSNDTEVSLSSNLAENAMYVPVDPISFGIVSYDTDSDWSSRQTAVVKVMFSDDLDELNDEFPEQNDKNGVAISAYSKLDYSPTNIFYSSNSKSADNLDKYYMLKSNEPSLVVAAVDQTVDDAYDKHGELSSNRSSLGINAKYLYNGKSYNASEQTEHIDADVDFDISNLPNTITTSGNYKLKYTIQLYQKQNDGEYHLVNMEDYEREVEGEADTVKGYLKNFKLIGTSPNGVTLTSNYESGCLYYTYEMPLTSDTTPWAIPYNATAKQKAFNASISFDVKSMGKLEAIPDYLYSNYQVMVTVDLIGTGGITSYTKSDWIIYTNAKVNAQYVSPN